LLKPIEEFRKYVVITGFRDARIKNVDDFLKTISKKTPQNVETQFFNAELVATWQHLYFAALNALTAFRNGENFSKSLAMETLLYASAQRQIRKATEVIGIKPNSTKIVALVIGEKPEEVKSTLSKISKQIGAKEDEAVLELTDQKTAKIKEAFGISSEELVAVMKGHNLQEALVDIVIEKMALLATEH
jgi:KEOPS complex subunit Cgi121